MHRRRTIAALLAAALLLTPAIATANDSSMGGAGGAVTPISDGTRISLSLSNEPALQRFPVSADAEWAKVTIGDVYRGTTRDETYLSEIEFGTALAPKMLAFDTVLAGGLMDASVQPTDQPQPDGNGEIRNPAAFPDALRDPGWPLFAGCVGCGVLLGLVIGGVIVLVVRRKRSSEV